MLTTGGIEYNRAFYYYDPELSQDKEIRYYKNDKNKKSFNEMLKPVIKLECDKGRYNKQVDSVYMLYFRNSTNWKNCFKTGLVRHAKSWVFHGDISQIMIFENESIENQFNPKHFVLLQFSKDTTTIVVDVFKGFYPYRIALKNIMILNHKYNFKYKKELLN